MERELYVHAAWDRSYAAYNHLFKIYLKNQLKKNHHHYIVGKQNYCFLPTPGYLFPSAFGTCSTCLTLCIYDSSQLCKRKEIIDLCQTKGHQYRECSSWILGVRGNILVYNCKISSPCSLGKAICQGAIRNFKLKMSNIIANVSILQDIVVHLLSCHEDLVLQQRKGKRCTGVVPSFETRGYFREWQFQDNSLSQQCSLAR